LVSTGVVFTGSRPLSQRRASCYRWVLCQ